MINSLDVMESVNKTYNILKTVINMCKFAHSAIVVVGLRRFRTHSIIIIDDTYE